MNFRGNREKFFLHRFMSIGKAKKVYFTINSYICKQTTEIINEKCHFLAIVERVLRAELAANFSTCKVFSQSEVSSLVLNHLSILLLSTCFRYIPFGIVFIRKKSHNKTPVNFTSIFYFLIST